MSGTGPTLARTFEVEDSYRNLQAYFDYCYEKGWTDGLPVVPPTEERVAAMLRDIGIGHRTAAADLIDDCDVLQGAAALPDALQRARGLVIAAAGARTHGEFNRLYGFPALRKCAAGCSQRDKHRSGIRGAQARRGKLEIADGNAGVQGNMQTVVEASRIIVRAPLHRNQRRAAQC